MRKILASGIAAGLVAGSLMLAAPASAGCQGGYGVGFGGSTCDGPVINGRFERCVHVKIRRWGGGVNCYMVDINNMGGQHIPYHIGY